MKENLLLTAQTRSTVVRMTDGTIAMDVQFLVMEHPGGPTTQSPWFRLQPHQAEDLLGQMAHFLTVAAEPKGSAPSLQ